MTIQHIGQDFTSIVKLNILPGIKLPRGIYQTHFMYITDVGGVITQHHMSQNMHGGSFEELNYIFGKDVRHVTFRIHCHNSFPTTPLIYYHYSIRLDHLMMLNLAYKFVKPRLRAKQAI